MQSVTATDTLTSVHLTIFFLNERQKTLKVKIDNLVHNFFLLITFSRCTKHMETGCVTSDAPSSMDFPHWSSVMQLGQKPHCSSWIWGSTNSRTLLWPLKPCIPLLVSICQLPNSFCLFVLRLVLPVQPDSISHHCCPPVGSGTAMTSTSSLATSAPHGHLGKGSTEHGPF